MDLKHKIEELIQAFELKAKEAEQKVEADTWFLAAVAAASLIHEDEDDEDESEKVEDE